MHVLQSMIEEQRLDRGQEGTMHLEDLQENEKKVDGGAEPPQA